MYLELVLVLILFLYLILVFLHLVSTYDSSNGKVVIAYKDSGNSDQGTANVFSPVTMGSNLTSENFIGISNGVPILINPNSNYSNRRCC